MDRPETRLSTVLVTWNSLAYLPACLRSLEEQTLPPTEIVVVDNGSDDGTRPWIRVNHPRVRLIENDGNRGFSVANNQGIAATSGEFVLALNTDVLLAPDFLEILVRHLEQDAGLGSASGKLLRGVPEEGGVPRIDSAGEIIYRSRRMVNRGEEEVDRGQFDRREEVFGVTAAAALYRRAMLEDIRLGEDEYFDNDYFSYLEDSDLNWRAQLRGWRCLYEPAAVGHHIRQHATNRSLAIRRHAYVNRYLSLIKNETAANLLVASAPLFLYEAFRACKVLWAERDLIGGWGKVLRLAPDLWRKRRSIQRRRRVSSKAIRRWMLPEDYLGELRARLARRREKKRDSAPCVTAR